MFSANTRKNHRGFSRKDKEEEEWEKKDERGERGYAA